MRTVIAECRGVEDFAQLNEIRVLQMFPLIDEVERVKVADFASWRNGFGLHNNILYHRSRSSYTSICNNLRVEWSGRGLNPSKVHTP